MHTHTHTHTHIYNGQFHYLSSNSTATNKRRKWQEICQSFIVERCLTKEALKTWQLFFSTSVPSKTSSLKRGPQTTDSSKRSDPILNPVQVAWREHRKQECYSQFAGRKRSPAKTCSQRSFRRAQRPLNASKVYSCVLKSKSPWTHLKEQNAEFFETTDGYSSAEWCTCGFMTFHFLKQKFYSGEPPLQNVGYINVHTVENDPLSEHGENEYCVLFCRCTSGKQRWETHTLLVIKFHLCFIGWIFMNMMLQQEEVSEKCPQCKAFICGLLAQTQLCKILGDSDTHFNK